MVKEHKDYNKMNLSELLDELKGRFRIKPNEKIPTYMFSLSMDERGYWSLRIIDDWHKWLDKGFSEPPYRYWTPELAIIRVLQYIDRLKINVKKLQSRRSV